MSLSKLTGEYTLGRESPASLSVVVVPLGLHVEAVQRGYAL
jgi:hypothetical protein